MQKFQFVWLHVTIWRDKLELLWRLHAPSEATLAGALPVCSGFGASLHDAGKLSSPAYELSNHQISLLVLTHHEVPVGGSRTIKARQISWKHKENSYYKPPPSTTPTVLLPPSAYAQRSLCPSIVHFPVKIFFFLLSVTFSFFSVFLSTETRMRFSTF